MRNPLYTLRFLTLALALAPVASVSGQALTYRQKQAVKNMTWTVKDIEKRVLPKYSDLKWLRGKVWTVPQLNRHIDAVNNGFRKLNNAVIHLNKAGCNTGQPEVKALVQRINAGRKTLQTASKELQVVAKKSQAAGDPNTYKEYKADTQRAKSIADVFQIYDFMASPAATQSSGKEFPRAVQWLLAREKFYKPFFAQQTLPAKQLQNALHRARSVLTKYKKTGQAFLKDAPKQIQGDLQQAEKYLQQAVAETKPLFLQGGVKQNMERANERLSVVESLLPKKRPAWLGTLRTRYTKLTSAKAAATKKMAAKILAERKAPQDNYGGADREKLREAIHKAWKKAHPKDEILAVRLPTNGWKRRKSARWVSDSWVFSDRSWIQLRVAVAAGEDRVSLYLAHVYKDNQTGKWTTSLADKNDKFHTVDQMLRTNWK